MKPMTGYTKLFGSIITSTIWCEDNHTRIVWITMLAVRNKDNIVEGSIPGLAAIARVPVDACRKAIEKFKSPDPDSRTKEFDGRRIQEVPGGWLLLNGDKYRKKMNEDERREYNRIKQAEHRARKAQSQVNDSQDVSTNVKDVIDMSARSAQSEAEAEAEDSTNDSSIRNRESASRHTPAKFVAPTSEEVSLQCAKVGLPEREGQKFYAYWSSRGWKRGRQKMESWTHSLTTWKLNWEEQSGPAGNGGIAQPGTWELKTKLEAIDREIDKLPEPDFRTKEQCARAKQLRADRDTINARLASI